MMGVLKSAALAFSSFSKMPMPQFEWREENMRYMMCFFPLVGLVVGLAVAAWLWLAHVADFGPFLVGAGVALVPVAVSGGIHLDGFCDVVDAQSSHATPERKREILKDPHVGAFASIGVVAYLLAYAAVGSELVPVWKVGVLVMCLHVVSRCLSGIATLVFPMSGSRGMLSMFHDSADSRRVVGILLVELLVCAAGMAFVSWLAAVPMLMAAVLCFACLRPFSRTQFGGMSGDVAGFFLQVVELIMLVVLVVVMKVVGL